METIQGKIGFIGDIKQFGKIKSKGIKLEENDVWFNIIGFNEQDIMDILGPAKKGDVVNLSIDTTEKGYKNIKEIEIVSSQEQHTLEKISQKIEINDIAIYEKCIEDAKNIVQKKYNLEQFEAMPTVMEIAKELFRSRTS